MNTSQHMKQDAQGARFAFGKNWSRFLAVLNNDRISAAEQALKHMLQVNDLVGKSFLDIGSGSGLSSLAAQRLGARVYSFDYDADSVACTAELKRRYVPDDPTWVIEQGSVLDTDYLQSLGTFDVVYSWGVLHHTGEMWKALENVVPLVKQGGELFIAIYNDQGRASQYWAKVKRIYNTLPRNLRFLVLIPATVRLWGPTMLRDMVLGRPFKTLRDRSKERGMAVWRDVVDWVGGWPFEVAKPEEIFDFYRKRGLGLTKLKTCAGGHGCNEYVFEKAGKNL